ncbi:glycoside hydrolase family 43 protein [Hymenobacter sp. GOD-10R]|uniref:glycoside hydrolase family 43 protein n=1 Tax=Hymenobacter sp. GOD-10R TaxID=3093922 RepID=UPI002D7725A7|nr:glycoside hydrolase family 43 protein [Hymenobacter sp. GOD-10R]WRQ29108.1 glycoside hydrolase family 43 protein [Hymenobacter sp. GOD-10R]
MVYRDTVFLYTGHDEDDATGFKMFNWLLYTSTDMVNWTDHGPVASTNSFSWSPKNGAWAPQCIERNGKFYMYCPIHVKGIGVLVSDSPYGPFTDPLGKPLIQNSNDDIDPTVYIDDDGQAYLYWGNPNLYYVKLNKDMISYSGPIVKSSTKPANYQEGPWFYKRKDKYYMAYASTCCPEGIGYSMSDSPTGPWNYTGTLMDRDPRSNGNHPGIIDYKGNSYLFGFNYAISKAQSATHTERRSVCLAKLTYNSDGTIQQLPFWSEAGVDRIAVLNPYKRNEAETIAGSQGLKTSKGPTGMYVTNIDSGDYIKVKGVDFEQGAKEFMAAVASTSVKPVIELHLDSPTGTLLGSLNGKPTGGLGNWVVQSCKVSRQKGVHDVYFVFKGTGSNLFRFDWWQFNQ